jgi:hypothetical protein
MKTMRYALVLGVIALFVSGAARADSIVYDVTGSFPTGAAAIANLSGTMTFDTTTTGLVTSANLSVPLGPFSLVLIQHKFGGGVYHPVGVFDAS